MSNQSLSTIISLFFCSGAFLFAICGIVFAIIFSTVIAPRTKKGVVNVKGNIGEEKVARILKGLNPRDFIVLNDVMLQRNVVKENELSTTQIDHVVVSVYGIFVIETKNYSGKIYGHEKSEKWQQYIRYDNLCKEFGLN